MLTKAMVDILKLASTGRLPRSIDQITRNVDLPSFKVLHRGGLIDAVDASAASGGCFLEPTITVRGEVLLQSLNASSPPWWNSFDRRLTVIGLFVAILGLAAGVGLLAMK